ncbi:MAG TPA: HD domain-containing protein [Bryobacteraceae bacterium]|nr:HD domain-containing protein [Bryobacteraceae bacterium]
MKTVENQPSNPESVRSQFLMSGNAAEAVAGRSTFVDQLVTHAFRSHLAPVFSQGMSVLAVGGYGRRELFPHSDIDLLLLIEKEIHGDAQRNALSTFLRTLWDNGLRVSQSVRSIAECCQFDQNNVELSVSLLDERFLIGDHDLYDSFSARLPKFIRSNRTNLIRHLIKLTNQRHAKFHDTIYHLEPNIKETPGGLRDLHVVHWLTKVRGGDPGAEISLNEARDFLWDVRCRLHYRAGRDSNVLTFDLQEELSAEPAAWMRDYYRHARDVHRCARQQMELSDSAAEGGLARQFREWRSRLSNADFTVLRERVFLRAPQQLASDPDLVLRLFQFVARHGIRLSLETERRVRDHKLYLEEYFASSRPLWQSLKQLLLLPHAAPALRAMHETGLLQIIIPVWEQIECLVVRDFYHRYTVDEHTLVTLEYLEELKATNDASRRRFRELVEETDEMPLLFMALLFHDMGKSDGLEGHAIASAKLAERVLERMQMPEAERRTVLFLIEQHLVLSAVMNSRDLSDPATAVELASRVETIERLRLLTLMTYADISAVNPDAMTPWRLEQLWRTYLVGHRELTRELDTERIHVPEHDETADFLEGLPTRYLRTHTPEQVQQHVALARSAGEAGLAVDLKRGEGVYALTVLTTDRPNLFASLAGILSSFGMNIVKAEAFANQNGTVLDTFCFADPMRTLELNPAEADRLKAVIRRTVLGTEDVQRLLRGRAKPPAPSKRAEVRPTVAFDAEASDSATLVEIVAEDRPGLLYDLASTFSSAGCSIEVVLIDTEAHKALDVFYITKEGGKLAPEEHTDLRDRLLVVCNH